jgi:uncharacterized protein YdaU (DUF1376 family)
MGKDPAFLFYPGDWTLGTMHLTLLEKGAYLELLILQFAKDNFTLAQAKHILGEDFENVWSSIVEKFKTDGTYFWNERLKEEKSRRKKYTESRRKNALTNSEEGKSHKKHMQQHMQQHMENENQNKADNRIKSVSNAKAKFTKPSIQKIQEYCKERGNTVSPETFFDFYESKGWFVGNTPHERLASSSKELGTFNCEKSKV